MYSDGIRNKVINVAKIMPKLSDIAIGMIHCACTLVSNMIGMRPAAVVKDVKMIARNRRVPDSMTACFNGTPSVRALLTKSTMIKLSLTTTPDNAISPKSENMLIALPMIK